MHDGRFTTLEQVVDFHDSGVQPGPALDPRLTLPPGAPPRAPVPHHCTHCPRGSGLALSTTGRSGRSATARARSCA